MSEYHDNLVGTLKEFSDRVNPEREAIANSLIGQKVRILSNYNGQSYGRSRKSKKGTIQTIREAYFYGTSWAICLVGEIRCLGLNEVEFIGETT